MLDANIIADFFIEISTPGTKKNITNLKLQKLLYYAQGMYLAEKSKSDTDVLFNERIEAWKHGPVVPEVYKRFSNYGFIEISKDDVDKESVQLVKSKKLDAFLEIVWKKYGSYNGKQLERMSHMEEPWLKTRGNLPSYVSSNEEIAVNLIKEFFIKKK